jgi:DNA invertase Pin-like site-specific DNA recombinase
MTPRKQPSAPPAPDRFAVAYIRVSTETQVRDGFGLDAQREEIETHAAAKGLEIVGWYEDAGVSGAAVDSDALQVDRDGLTSMLAEAPSLGATLVLVANTSRLWRSDMVRVLIQREMKRAGLDVRSAQQPSYSIHTGDPTDFLVNGMMELLDAYQRLEIALKLKKGRRAKSKRGGFAGGRRALGYSKAAEGADLVIDAAEAETVRRIWKLRQEGQSLRQIAAELNATGLLTKRGSRWHPSTVLYVLDNPIYTGILSHAGTEAARTDLQLVA